MKVKILEDRATFRRFLRMIRKSKILAPMLKDHWERTIVFEIEDNEDGAIMSSVIKEFIVSQKLRYEEF